MAKSSKAATTPATKNTVRGAHPQSESPIDKETLDAFVKIEDERKKLNQRVTVLEKEAALHKEKFLEQVRAHGGPAKMLVAYGHRFTIHSKAKTVSWKDEFVRVAGADAALQVVGKQPKRESLDVEPLEAD